MAPLMGIRLLFEEANHHGQPFAPWDSTHFLLLNRARKSPFQVLWVALWPHSHSASLWMRGHSQWAPATSPVGVATRRAQRRSWSLTPELHSSSLIQICKNQLADP